MDFRAGRSPDGSRDPSTLVPGANASAPLMKDGDLVVFFEGREGIGFDTLKSKGIWQCRHGAFHHNEMIGKPFGSKVFSRTTKGFVYALSPTPELWSQVVPSRTQIVQDFDQSIITFRLDLKPGDVVIESGTGSGVMSSAIMRTIAPTGFLYTFEFNQTRANKAQEEFTKNGLGDLAKVVHRDVCAEREEDGGFGEDLNEKADAVFLDLPEPWLAVGHAKRALKPGSKVCTYSPCIEQVMKTCEALRSQGFNSITTIEFRLRSINYCEIKLDAPDFGYPPSVSATPAQTSTAPVDIKPIQAMDCQSEDEEAAAGEEGARDTDTMPEAETCAARRDGEGGEGTAPGTGEAALVAPFTTAPEGMADDSAREIAGLGEIPALPTSRVDRDDGEQSHGNSDTRSTVTALSTSNKRPRQPEGERNRDIQHGQTSGNSEVVAVANGDRKRSRMDESRSTTVKHEATAGNNLKTMNDSEAKTPLSMVCAQPYPIMRGHTAFLTFATSPVSRRRLQAKEDCAGDSSSASEVSPGHAREVKAGDSVVDEDAIPKQLDPGSSEGQAAPQSSELEVESSLPGERNSDVVEQAAAHVVRRR